MAGAQPRAAHRPASPSNSAQRGRQATRPANALWGPGVRRGKFRSLQRPSCAPRSASPRSCPTRPAPCGAALRLDSEISADRVIRCPGCSGLSTPRTLPGKWLTDWRGAREQLLPKPQQEQVHAPRRQGWRPRGEQAPSPRPTQDALPVGRRAGVRHWLPREPTPSLALTRAAADILKTFTLQTQIMEI
ncbi:PREDICTED: uncharacterized protein LOC106148218 [Chinchilla lanigera]|uniref:uncharacterized protein LOC106148218 n=1 Tax=Chinchilla lanigera TaxID=34839 RepID=UPI00069796B3|nr:PREDICTED: uncharacterized protein LOC106148218 [Chinchilla lanigera]